jgi:hypothetical protein
MSQGCKGNSGLGMERGKGDRNNFQKDLVRSFALELGQRVIVLPTSIRNSQAPLGFIGPRFRLHQ